MNENVLVSVVMITYNHEPYIRKAIDCILGQKTGFLFELLIGEDCSTDGTREIVFDYQKRYPDIVKVITSDMNVGVHKNLFRTEKASCGEYIAYCEGDDYWHHPEKLQKQVDYMESHVKCGLVCSDFDRFIVASQNRKTNMNSISHRNPSKDTDFCKIVSGTPTSGILTCTVMVKSDLLFRVIQSDPVLYELSQFPAGDTPRWAEISRLATIGYIDESLATYNGIPESATRAKDPRKILKTSMRMKDQMLYFVDKYNLPDAERNKHQEDWCKRALKLAFYEKDRHLVNEVKQRKKSFSFLERLECLGAQNSFWHYALSPILHTCYIVSRKIIP